MPCQWCMQDLDLIWDNAVLYNGANTDVGKSASDLKRYSRSALKRAGLDTLDGAQPPCAAVGHASMTRSAAAQGCGRRHDAASACAGEGV